MSSNKIQLSLIAICLLGAPLAQAMPINEVLFEKGSSCGNYKGDLIGGRLFEVVIEAGQQLVISTDGHVQSVTDSQGEVLEDKGGINYLYQPIHSGTHTIKLVGRAHSEAEFCVY